jgi:decaprenylphospho-beta-D-ribofuranose 2-oxidase
MSPDRLAGLPGDDQLLAGWGRTAPTRARVITPLDDGDVGRLLDVAPPRGAIARGLGRSYGDAAQNAGGMVLDATALAGIKSVDLEGGHVTVGAGTTLDELMRWLIPRGWFVPVTPGTKFVTIGGAIASDIHGKSHHVDGTFGSHVQSLTLRTGSGDILTVTPKESPEVFWATCGGMGLTGIIIDATFDLIPIETSMIVAEEERCRDLDELMARMSEDDERHRYSAAWIDCLARGKSLGRGVLERGDHAPLDALPKSSRGNARHFTPRPLAVAPDFVPSGLLNPLTIRAFNEMWFRKSRKHHVGLVPLGFFFHPLDLVESWNRLYGRRGFVQYQCVLPFGAETTLRFVMEQLSQSGMASFLAVLKRFGAENPGMLSFPKPGWTLALDIPVGSPDLARLLDRLDEAVLEADGRVYLAKDARTRPEHLGQMYPRLPQWREVRAKLDPDGVITSDLARRLGLDDPIPEGTMSELTARGGPAHSERGPSGPAKPKAGTMSERDA